MASAYGAGAGADMLQTIILQKRQEQEAIARQNLAAQNLALEAKRIKIAQQSADDNTAYRTASLKSLDDDRASAAKARAQSGAEKLASTLAPGSTLDAAGAGTLRGGDLGSLIQHKDATLGSTNLSGVSNIGNVGPGFEAPQITRIARTANPGQDAKDIYQGTAAQQQAEQHRKMLEVFAQSPEASDELKMWVKAGGVGQPPTALMKSKNDTEDVYQTGPNGQLVKAGTVPKGSHIANAPNPIQDHFSTQVITGADGKQQLVRINTQTGAVAPVDIGSGATPGKIAPPTESQTNLGIYASRLQQAIPALEAITPAIMSMNPASFEAQKWMDKPYLQSKEMQAYQQAARMFINSTLRRESGAAISPSEFAEAQKQYLPIPGDTKQALEMKARARADVAANFAKYASGSSPATAPAAAKPTAEDLLKKYGGG